MGLFFKTSLIRSIKSFFKKDLLIFVIEIASFFVLGAFLNVFKGAVSIIESVNILSRIIAISSFFILLTPAIYLFRTINREKRYIFLLKTNRKCLYYYLSGILTYTILRIAVYSVSVLPLLFYLTNIHAYIDVPFLIYTIFSYIFIGSSLIFIYFSNILREKFKLSSTIISILFIIIFILSLNIYKIYVFIEYINYINGMVLEYPNLLFSILLFVEFLVLIISSIYLNINVNRELSSSISSIDYF
ncbi:MAG: hypothetical protein CR982_05590 [Candidatus Cloacimonadota bacterium]|nr:MAG: hypothetical protein CR982_05590 [Candidatus Cloacimonadota bacterium]PIE81405.1 MAG: hypothetical protein CSA15_00780 [Candidatus Delongbacteria bacterium]